MKHLVKKANRYYIHWNIPKDVRHLFEGLAIYSRSLKTDNLGQALMRRDQLLEELEGVVRKARVNPERQQFLALVKEIRKAAGAAVSDDEHESLVDGQDALLESAINSGDTVKADAIKVAMGWSNGEDIEAKYSITLKEATKLYIEQAGDTLTHSIASRLKVAPVLFTEYLRKKDVHLADIDKRDVSSWVLECSKSKAPKTVKAYTTGLSTVWEWAYRNREVDGDNPFRDLNVRLSSATKKRGTFTVEQVAALINEASPAIQALVKFALATGCRLGEMTALTPQDFHVTDNVHYFTVIEGKTENAARTVPLPEALWEEMKGVVEAGLWTRVMTNTKRTSAQYWSVAFQRHRDTALGAGTGATFHSFRKMTATAYQQAKVFEGVAAETLGHSKTGLTLSYGLYATGYTFPQKLEAVETMLGSGYMQSYLKLFK